MPKQPDLDLIQKHVSALEEHFDTVMIFATRHDPAEAGGTEHCSMGGGNWYARFGQVKEWVIRQEEMARVHVRVNQEDE